MIFNIQYSSQVDAVHLHKRVILYLPSLSYYKTTSYDDPTQLTKIRQGYINYKKHSNSCQSYYEAIIVPLRISLLYLR